jgi:hypothetical protein
MMIERIPIKKVRDEKMCSEKNLFYKIWLPPLRQPSPPWGGGACDVPVLPIRKLAAFFLNR